MAESFSTKTAGLLPRLVPAGFLFLCQVSVAAELLVHNGISVQADSLTPCKPAYEIELVAGSLDQFKSSRLDMQELSNITKTYVWLRCKDVETLSYKGYVGSKSGEAVYFAEANKDEDWYLLERDSEAETNTAENEAPELTSNRDDQDTDVDEQPALSPEEPDQPTYTSMAELEAAAQDQTAAKLELAKGLLGMESDSIDFDIEQDPERAVTILEPMAEAGNADAMYLLGEAYANNQVENPNMPLLKNLLSRVQNIDELTSEQLGAQMAAQAAMNGSEMAVDAIEEVGANGSAEAYYFLGMSYLQDRTKVMPYGNNFLSNSLSIPPGVWGAGGPGNVNVGLHFMSLSALEGNLAAQSFLNSTGVRYSTSRTAITHRNRNLQRRTVSRRAVNRRVSRTRAGATRSVSRMGGAPSFGAAGMPGVGAVGAGMPAAGAGGAPGAAAGASAGVGGAAAGAGMAGSPGVGTPGSAAGGAASGAGAAAGAGLAGGASPGGAGMPASGAASGSGAAGAFSPASNAMNTGLTTNMVALVENGAMDVMLENRQAPGQSAGGAGGQGGGSAAAANTGASTGAVVSTNAANTGGQAGNNGSSSNGAGAFPQSSRAGGDDEQGNSDRGAELIVD